MIILVAFDAALTVIDLFDLLSCMPFPISIKLRLYGDDVRQVADLAFLVRDLGAEILRNGETALAIRYAASCSMIVVRSASLYIVDGAGRVSASWSFVVSRRSLLEPT